MHGEVWPKEKVNELKFLHDQGDTYSLIGKKLGKTKSAVAGMVRRLGLNTRGTPISPRWTKEQDEEMVKLQAQGRSYSEIARRLGFTAHAVGNRFRRLQLKKHNKALKRTQKRTVKTVGNTAEKPKRPCVTPPPRYDKRAPEMWKSLGGKCQWPIGDPKDDDFHHCHKPAKDAPYCEEHLALAYIVKERKAPEQPAPRPELRSDFR